MRFASREKAILSQWEVGAGLVPGGGPMARLPRLMGRGRALEVLLGADDVSGELAERYGYAWIRNWHWGSVAGVANRIGFRGRERPGAEVHQVLDLIQRYRKIKGVS
jgi:hypothetical protein